MSSANTGLPQNRPALKTLSHPHKPSVVIFFAEWCPPCQRMAPVLDRVENRFGPNLQVTRINVDRAMQFRIDCGVVKVPTIFVMGKGGDCVEEFAGEMSEELLLQKLIPLVPDNKA